MQNNKPILNFILSMIFSVYMGIIIILFGSVAYGSIVMGIAYKSNDVNSKIPNNTEAISEEISKVHSVMNWSFFIAALIVLVFLIICSICFYKDNILNIRKNKFIANMREFLSKVLLSLISVFSITYGFIGNSIESASNGIILSVFIVSISLLSFGLMIIGHLKMIYYNKDYFYNKSNYVVQYIKRYENRNDNHKPLIMP